jgi:hypothetical protein
MAHIGKELQLGLIGHLGFRAQAALLDQQTAVLIPQKQRVCRSGMELPQNEENEHEIANDDKRELLKGWIASNECRAEKPRTEDSEDGQGKRPTGP